jgi:hypothetical protein
MKTICSVLGITAMIFSVTVSAQTRFSPSYPVEQPVVEEPVVQEPVVEEPVVVPEPVVEEPVVVVPPVVEEPVVAQPVITDGPTSHAAARLLENMEKNPQSEGLPKAFARVNVERPIGRVERPERVEHSARNEIARANRPERPQGKGRR